MCMFYDTFSWLKIVIVNLAARTPESVDRFRLWYDII